VSKLIVDTLQNTSSVGPADCDNYLKYHAFAQCHFGNSRGIHASFGISSLSDDGSGRATLTTTTAADNSQSSWWSGGSCNGFALEQYPSPDSPFNVAGDFGGVTTFGIYIRLGATAAASDATYCTQLIGGELA
jgi:hypothetical protein